MSNNIVCAIGQSPLSPFLFHLSFDRIQSALYYNWQKFAQENRITYQNVPQDISYDKNSSDQEVASPQVILSLIENYRMRPVAGEKPTFDQFLSNTQKLVILITEKYAHKPQKEMPILVFLGALPDPAQQEKINNLLASHWSGPSLILWVEHGYGYLPQKNQSALSWTGPSDEIDFIYQLAQKGIPMNEVMNTSQMNAPFVATSWRYAYHVMATLLNKGASGVFTLSSRGDGSFSRFWEVTLHQTQNSPTAKPGDKTYESLLQEAQNIFSEIILPSLAAGQHNTAASSMDALLNIYPNIVDFHEGFCDYVLERLQAE